MCCTSATALEIMATTTASVNWFFLTCQLEHNRAELLCSLTSDHDWGKRRLPYLLEYVRISKLDILGLLKMDIMKKVDCFEKSFNTVGEPSCGRSTHALMAFRFCTVIQFSIEFTCLYISQFPSCEIHQTWATMKYVTLILSCWDPAS